MNEIELMISFLHWKDNLRKIKTSNGTLYDVAKYHKYLTETELIDYYLKLK